MSRPTLFVSYAWLLWHGHEHTEEELNKGLYPFDIPLDQINNSPRCLQPTLVGESNQERITRHIKKAVKEKRYCYVAERKELNEFLIKNGILPYGSDEDEMYKRQFVAHLEQQGYIVANFPKNYYE